MLRLLFGFVLFALILGSGVIWTATPGSEAAYEAAEARIAEAIEEDRRVLRLNDLSNLGELPPRIGELTDVRQLDLRGTVVSDVSALASMENLRILTLRDTLVRDVGPLAALPKLDTLDIGGTWVRDIEPLTASPSLRRLDIGRTWTESLEPATRIGSLEWINLHGAYATDGSRTHFEVLRAGDVTVNNGRAFREDYRPDWFFRQRVRLGRLERRVRLGLGALD